MHALSCPACYSVPRPARAIKPAALGAPGASGAPMLMVACRLMTSGDRGVSLEGSSVFKSCERRGAGRGWSRSSGRRESPASSTIGLWVLEEALSHLLLEPSTLCFRHGCFPLDALLRAVTDLRSLGRSRARLVRGEDWEAAERLAWRRGWEGSKVGRPSHPFLPIPDFSLWSLEWANMSSSSPMARPMGL
jgi:hypothetical protein